MLPDCVLHSHPDHHYMLSGYSWGAASRHAGIADLWHDGTTDVKLPRISELHRRWIRCQHHVRSHRLLRHERRARIRADENANGILADENANGTSRPAHDMRRRVFNVVRDGRLQSQRGRCHNCLWRHSVKRLQHEFVLHGHPNLYHMLSRYSWGAASRHAGFGDLWHDGTTDVKLPRISELHRRWIRCQHHVRSHRLLHLMSRGSHRLQMNRFANSRASLPHNDTSTL